MNFGQKCYIQHFLCTFLNASFVYQRRIYIYLSLCHLIIQNFSPVFLIDIKRVALILLHEKKRMLFYRLFNPSKIQNMVIQREFITQHTVSYCVIRWLDIGACVRLFVFFLFDKLSNVGKGQWYLRIAFSEFWVVSRMENGKVEHNHLTLNESTRADNKADK